MSCLSSLDGCSDDDGKDCDDDGADDDDDGWVLTIAGTVVAAAATGEDEVSWGVDLAVGRMV